MKALPLKRRAFLTTLVAMPVMANLPKFAFAASADPYPTMTAFLDEMIADEQFNGSVTAIYKKGKPNFMDVLGTMDGEKKVPMKCDAIFALASMTKPITATVDDYLQFTKMLLNKGTLDGVRILPSKTVESMSVDRLKPEEHKEGGFFTRYPGRGFGYMVAVRTDALPDDAQLVEFFDKHARKN